MDHGATSTTSSTPPSNTWTGSTTAGFSNPSGTSHQQKRRPTTTVNHHHRQTRDSNKTLFDKPGAVQKEQKRLKRLFEAYPRLKVAWDALQELYGLYEAEDLPSALQALERFANLYETGQIPEYHNTVTTVLNWSDEILNWHHARRSNGPLEGINNLIQTLRRTAHGFTNPHNYAARALLLT